ncbi:MAG: thioesterase [Gemmatimonadetes bacterium]|nr:thioesterase [Gemmatimonadota bacterium]
MGVVYYAHYFAWFEAGRGDYLRELGADYRMLEEGRGVFIPVLEASAKYRRGAEFDDVVLIATSIEEANRVRLRFSYEVHRQSDGELLASGSTIHAAVGRDGRARPMPRELLRLIPIDEGD